MKILDVLIQKLGKTSAWCCVLLIVFIVLEVMMRYVFNMSFIWMSEVEVYLFTLIIVIGFSYGLLTDTHVRVDVFYEKWSLRKKAINDTFGIIFLLIPWCIVALIATWKFASFSFVFREKSPQAGGLPWLFLLKFILFGAFGLLLAQGISMLVKNISQIKAKE